MPLADAQVERGITLHCPPFVSSIVETRAHGISTALDANGLRI